MIFKEKLYDLYLNKAAWLTVALSSIASTATASGLAGAGITGTGTTVNWPWKNFLISLASEMTGDSPTIIACIAFPLLLFAAFRGYATQAIGGILAFIIAFAAIKYAPDLIGAMDTSASGLSILMGM